MKYNRSSGKSLSVNPIWEYYQAGARLSVVPSHILLSTNSTKYVLNFLSLRGIGADTLQASTAFSKIQIVSKVNALELFSSAIELNARYLKLYNLYLNETNLNHHTLYGTLRQHGSTTGNAYTPHPRLSLDKESVSRLVKYNYLSIGGWYKVRTLEEFYLNQELYNS